MPYFFWIALNIEGETHCGTLFANNEVSLEKKLFNKQLGLIRSHQTYSFSKMKLSKKEIAQALKDIAHLMAAKIPVYQAFQLVSSMHKNSYLKVVLQEVADTIYSGASLDQALSWHQDIMNVTMLGLIKAGQETGKLSETLNKIAEHSLVVERLKNELRSLLFMPAMTLCAFFLLLGVFLVSIVPRFELFFQASDKDLPWMTLKLIAISNTLISLTFVHWILIVICLCVGSYFLIRLTKNWFSQILFAANLGSLLITWNIAQILQLLAILVGSGISLVSSLSLCTQSIHNSFIAQDLQKIQQAVNEGMQITTACSKSTFFAQQDLQAILSLGESSAELAVMIQQAADVYHLRAHTAMKRWVALSQPISLILLGFLIAGLLYCLYVPIFTISHIAM